MYLKSFLLLVRMNNRTNGLTRDNQSDLQKILREIQSARYIEVPGGREKLEELYNEFFSKLPEYIPENKENKDGSRRQAHKIYF